MDFMLVLQPSLKTYFQVSDRYWEEPTFIMDYLGQHYPVTWIQR